MNKWHPRLVAVALTLLAAGAVFAQQESPITIKVLYDNYTSVPELTADWGFSCLVTGTEKTILFDTGTKKEILLENMAKMDIDLSAVDLVVISHNHGDHTGGLISVLERNNKITVYLPPSCPESMVRQLEGLGAKVVTVTKPVEICPGVFVIGPVGDKIVEQAVAVTTEKGPVIITGCSHPGVVTLATRAKEQLGRDIYMVCGGMHLLDMSDADVEKMASELRQLGVQKCGPTHCTGENAIRVFKRAFGDAFVQMGVGSAIQVGNAKKSDAAKK